MIQEKIKEIREVLKEVKYPGTSKHIVELDMVQRIHIEGDKVMFRLVFQNSNDPFVAAIEKKCRALLIDYPEVEIETVFMHDLERPLSLEKVRQVIAVSILTTKHLRNGRSENICIHQTHFIPLLC